MSEREVLILGGGYAGLACLRALSRRLDLGRYRLRLIDATPHHTVKTRFHERAVLKSRELLLRIGLQHLVVASGGEFVQDEVVGVDFAARCVVGRGEPRPYHRLVIALGGEIAYFGVPGAREHTVSLQTYEQAAECCRRIQALELDRRTQPARVVVVGAGIEGLEVATMLRQIAPRRRCEIVLVERSETLMAQSQCRDSQRQYVLRFLERKEVDLRLGSTIQAVEADHVSLTSGEDLAADLVIWCSGIRRVELGGLDEGKPFSVSRHLQCTEHPDVFAIGDFATVESGEAWANLRSAQRADYQGNLAAENLWRDEAHRPMRPARYRPVGELTALGDYDGVGIVLGVPLQGAPVAAIKKAHEAKYLADLHRDVPRSMLRSLLSPAG
jgi:NADH dehydrogenase